MLVGMGCKDSKDGKSASASEGAGGYNLLLITLDTTRADHIGCYGWTRAATPVLDSLARTGVKFEQAFSHAPITLPSHTSLLTGTLPPEHGVRDNGRYVLGPELPTLAEVYRQHGYKTGAFVAAGVLDSRYGLDRGFDTYDDEMPRNPAGEPYRDRHGDAVCDRALTWLEQTRDKPFMCWVHFFDPHAPYVPPPAFLAKTGDPYDGEIAFVDAQIGRLMDWLKTNDLSSRTLVVAVADHGESLGDQGYLWHALLVYVSTMRVPLILSLPGRLPQGTSSPDMAGISDIMPTILDFMGWSVPDQVTGRSLLPALRGHTMPAHAIYGESDFPYNSFGWSKLRCLVNTRWKYIRAPKAELYDRLADPGETQNLTEVHPDVTQKLEADLAALEENMAVRESPVRRMDADTRQTLRSLGYVGGEPPQVEPANLKNPRDMVHVNTAFREAESLLGARRPKQAIALLEPAVKESPESFVLVEMLGKAYAMVGRFKEAERLLLEALVLYPDSADTYELLSITFASQSQFDKAIEACQKVLEIEPDHERGRALLEKLRADKAARG